MTGLKFAKTVMGVLFCAVWFMLLVLVACVYVFIKVYGTCVYSNVTAILLLQVHTH